MCASIHFSGIREETGKPVRQAVDTEWLRKLAGGKAAEAQADERRPIFGIDDQDLAQAGWAVVFPPQADPRIRDALLPLLDRRQDQAGALYKELRCPQSASSKSVAHFLGERGSSSGPVNPKLVPYYLLLVGSPQEIGLDFQFSLSVDYAVGRLHFDGPDRYDQYQRYALNVVRSEEKAGRPRPRLTLFGPRHEEDEPTALSLEHLVGPLRKRFSKEKARWSPDLLIAEDANKEQLLQRFGTEQASDLIFTAGHGTCYYPNSRSLYDRQGALICQDWPGPHWDDPLPRRFYLSANDLVEDADLGGLIAFLFACYSAGTPEFDSFSLPPDRERAAPRSFIARLPQRLLSHRRGACAVIGHIDQAYWHSFMWKEVGHQTQAFESALQALLEGVRVGHAVSSLKDRYTSLAEKFFQATLQRRIAGEDPDDVDPYLWTAILDASSYVVLGDPAARLNVREAVQSQPVERISAKEPQSRIHALLIGAGFYFPKSHFKNSDPETPTYPHLKGTVNDIEEMRVFLQDELDVPTQRIKVLKATYLEGKDEPPEDRSQWPTYQNMVDSIKEMIHSARTGDEIFIFFAGHGGRVQTSKRETKGEDGLDETLVPIDIADPKERHLRDIEIAKLIQSMDEMQLYSTFILDCCHAGGAPRKGKKAFPRGIAKIDKTVRPNKSMVAPLEELAANWRRMRNPTRDADTVSWAFASERFVLMAACRPMESAYESEFVKGRVNGAFTFWLSRTFREFGSDLTYQELHDRVSPQVTSIFRRQAPMLHGNGSRLVLNRRILSRAQRMGGASGYKVQEVSRKGSRVRLSGGQAVGIRKRDSFAIYPFKSRDFSRAADRLAMADVVDLKATDSWAEVTERKERSTIEVGSPAVHANVSAFDLVGVISVADTRSSSPHGRSLQAVRDALREHKGILVADSGKQPVSFQVTVDPQGKFEVLDPAGVPIPNLRPPLEATPDSVEQLLARLIHLTRFRNVLRLDNRDSSSPLRQGVSASLRRLNQDFEPGQDLRHFFAGPPLGDLVDIGSGDRLGLSLKNQHSNALNLAVLNLEPGWGVTVAVPATEAFFTLDPGQEEHISFKFTLPDGIDEGTDVLKIIATEQVVDCRVLELPQLDRPDVGRKGTDSNSNELEILFDSIGLGVKRAARREFGASAGWTTVQKMIRLRNSDS